MDTATIAGLLTLSGTLAGGALGVFGKALADLMQTKREREIRSEQREVELTRWQREQVILLLTNCAKSATLYTTLAVGKRTVDLQNDSTARQVSAELQGWLIAFAAIYPNPSSQEYLELVENLDRSLWQAVPEVDPVWKIRQLLVKLALQHRTT